MAKYFPLFLDIQDKPCLVVGAGQIATNKAEQLLKYGAKLTVVAPEASEQIRQWAAQGLLTYLPRAFLPDDLDGQTLVVGSTNAPSVNTQVFEEATRRGVMANIVDVPELCNFIYGAVVQRGDLQIAISTSGQSPVFAAQLRQQLELQFGEEYAAYLEILGEARRLARERLPDPETQKRAYDLILKLELLPLISDGKTDAAREATLQVIATLADEKHRTKTK